MIKQESLHNHPITPASNEKVKDEEASGEAKEAESVKPKAEQPLWKNWAMISAVIAYCFWGLHDMAYSEVRNKQTMQISSIL
jgi:hypothetical protein